MIFEDIPHIIKCYNKMLHKGLKCKEKCITFNDKMKWISIFDCNIVKSNCADKIKAKEYVKNVIGKDISIPILKIYSNINDIIESDLPSECVLKCNHGSGYNIVLNDKKLDFNLILSKLKRWINKDYSDQAGELHYHWIDRKIYCEKYVHESIYEYRIYCFNEKPIFMDAVYKRNNIKVYNTYDLNFQPISITNYDSNYDLIPRPKLLNDMLKYSNILCKGFKFVRIDFFNIEDNLYFTELTFTPLAGRYPLKEKYDKEFGSLLKI